MCSENRYLPVNVGDDKDTRRGQVLTLLAEQALQCLDFKASSIHCQDVMAAGTWLTSENEGPVTEMHESR